MRAGRLSFFVGVIAAALATAALGIAYAKARDGKLSFPPAGNGSTPHLAGEMSKSMAGVNVTRSPAEFTAIVRTDTVRYARIVKQAGVRMD